MATLAQRIIDLATAVGGDVKALTINQGQLANLSTTSKANLVSAINELYVALGNKINDAAGDGNVTETWSANKIYDTIEAAKLAVKDELTNGATAALDTLGELAAALGSDPNFATTIATELGNRVRYDAPQTLTALQKTQVCENIGVGEPDSNFVTSYVAAKA